MYTETIRILTKLGMLTEQNLNMVSIKGVFCVETASALHGLSTADPYPLTIYTLGDTKKIEGVHLIGISSLDGIETETLENGLVVTTKLQTVVDLIRFDCYEEFVFQSIDSYLDNYSEESLRERCKDYGVEEKLQYFLDNMQDFYDDFSC
ncbi:hypothetical protein D3C81_10780 [compost metagenome]